jgi:hypothetical protein
MNADDPQLTAYALDELPEPERSAVARAVAESPELQRVVEETRSLAASLRAEFQHDLRAADARPLNVMPLPEQRAFWSDSNWGPLAVAALLAMCAVVAAVLMSGKPDDSRGQRQHTIVMEVDTSTPAMASSGNEFVAAEAVPISGFPLVVNSSSWLGVRQLLEAGKRPPRDAVQVEAIVNAFTYEYEQPQGDAAFAIEVEAASCPWAPEHQLVRIGIQAREGEEIVARDAKVQVQFRAGRVAEYRLLGYDARGAGEHGSSGEEIRGGHQVTALYEVKLVNRAAGPEPLLEVSLAGQSRSLPDQQLPFAAASPEFRFAAAVAEFALALRGEAGTSLARAIGEAEAATQQRPERAQFVQLARRAGQLPEISFSPNRGRDG